MKKEDYIFSIVIMKCILSAVIIISTLLPWFSIPFSEHVYETYYGYRIVFLWGEKVLTNTGENSFFVEWYGFDKLIYILFWGIVTSLIVLVITLKRFFGLKRKRITYDAYFRCGNITQIIILGMLLWFSSFTISYTGYFVQCKESGGHYDVGFWIFYIITGMLIIIQLAESIYKYLQIENIEVWYE